MGYTRERDQFVAQATREGLPLHAAQALLRCATTIHRLAELACSSEAADRDRIGCPAATLREGATLAQRMARPCLCEGPDDGTRRHQTIPRIRLQDWHAEQRARAAVPAGWAVLTAGDPRGYTLRIVPPAYAEKNEGRDVHNMESIGVPARDSGIRW